MLKLIGIGLAGLMFYLGYRSPEKSAALNTIVLLISLVIAAVGLLGGISNSSADRDSMKYFFIAAGLIFAFNLYARAITVATVYSLVLLTLVLLYSVPFSFWQWVGLAKPSATISREATSDDL